MENQKYQITSKSKTKSSMATSRFPTISLFLVLMYQIILEGFPGCLELCV
ncbi:hypothetical protein Fmac_017772 [Flemingia macrophylla]|uniref:Uncharacterized protein n=1 Tax=Flemingia macrophylla TaxID=520843 RepID=A0ABD1M340_9FABA